MKIIQFIAIFAVGMLPLCGEPERLTEPERETLIATLDKLRELANTEVETKYRAAVVAFQGALENDQAAVALYEKCVELVDFEKRNRTEKDFREWKRRNKDQMEAPGFGLALRFQLRWLLLTIYASTAPDRDSLASNAAEIVSSIFQSVDRLKGQQNRLREGVLGTVFARAYDLGGLEVENWPRAPFPLGEVYDKVILPPFRNPSSTDKLRAAWTNRILYEARIVEDMNPPSDREGAKEQQMERVRTFYNDVQPDLIWEMEADLFRAGDQKAAAKNMLDHLKEHLAHDRARQWEKDFRKLVAPPAEVPEIE